MIKQKLKTCKGPCGKEVYLFSSGLCKQCWQAQNPTKINLKPSRINRTTPEQKSRPKSTKKSISRQSQTAIARTHKYQKIRDKFLQENPICQFPGCGSREVECHHMRGKIGDLYFDDKYFFSTCRFHHEYIHSHVLEAYKNGWLLSRINKPQPSIENSTHLSKQITFTLIQDKELKGWTCFSKDFHPGIVCEGNTEEEALTEFVKILNNDSRT